MMEDKGYYQKYVVKHTDGTEVKGRNHFVLSLDLDKNARIAALVYASLEGNLGLLDDLKNLFYQNGLEF